MPQKVLQENRKPGNQGVSNLADQLTLAMKLICKLLYFNLLV